MPLIERVARVGKPPVAALCAATPGPHRAVVRLLRRRRDGVDARRLGSSEASVGVAVVSARLFVGEHWIRRGSSRRMVSRD
jgi:hypothetical protein